MGTPIGDTLYYVQHVWRVEQTICDWIYRTESTFTRRVQYSGSKDELLMDQIKLIVLCAMWCLCIPIREFKTRIFSINVLPLVYEIINHSTLPSSEMTNKMWIMWHDERWCSHNFLWFYIQTHLHNGLWRRMLVAMVCLVLDKILFSQHPL